MEPAPDESKDGSNANVDLIAAATCLGMTLGAAVLVLSKLACL